MKTSIIDVGVGNVSSLENAINYLGIDYNLVNSKSDLIKTTHLILPGVGSFDSLIAALEKYDLKSSIKEYILEGKSFLGICVGMQILMNGSEEGSLEGLSIFDGYVEKLRFQEKKNFFVPNVGYCKIFNFDKKNFFKDLDNDSNFYFTHSYGVKKINNKNNYEYNIANTIHNDNFISAINYKKICGVQFHPEKSQTVGLKILKNFFDL
tara:strand:- start:162 stop:785 length:624 start_codon:yes stop_codon:yes gene_type:complete